MLTGVPQYIDVEDKVAGPLTMKQLGWMLLMGIVLLVFWVTVPKSFFWIIFVPVILFFSALAFYRPYGQSCASFIMYGFLYLFKPKVYVWKRSPQIFMPIKASGKNVAMKQDTQIVHEHEIKELAGLLDSEGGVHSEDAMKFLEKHPGARVSVKK